jgi:uracil-DNA glycosylase
MIKPNWQQIIDQEKLQDYYCQLQENIAKQRAQGIVIFPEEKDVFHAFEYSDLSDVKVVVIGQDPYHGVGKGEYCNQPQAHGLAFSVTKNIKVPPSLINIYKELTNDINDFITPTHGNLTSWAEQGVLLLNTVLTVQQGKAHSHAKLGWERFTDKIIAQLNEHNNGCVFILWGAHAQKKGRNIDGNKHLVLNGPHPSPLSAYRGFFGCKHFSKANTWLACEGKQVINWTNL